MGVRNGSLTEGDGKEHLSNSPSSVCRSSFPWFCMICPIGCLNIAGVIDSRSWRRMATAGYFLPSIEPPSRLGNLTLETRLNFSRMSCLFLTVLWWTCSRKDLNMVAEQDRPKRAVVTVRPGREQPLLWWWKCTRACTHAGTPRTCRRAIHFWQVVLPKQTDAIDLSQHREKIGFRKGRNHIHGMFKLRPTMWVCRQELQWSNDGVYTYPDIRISGYPDVRDPDIFGAFTRVGSKRFRRLHVSRHPDALYQEYIRT